MEALPNSNEEIVNYFEKFKDNKNYQNLLEKFKELTKIKVKGMIQLQEHNFPELGPSDELENFPDLLEDWDQTDVFEVKNIIKLYDTGCIESVEEAIILIEILKRKSKKYPAILDRILKDFQSQTFEDIGVYDQLLSLEVNPQDSIIYNGIWNFLMTLLS